MPRNSKTLNEWGLVDAINSHPVKSIHKKVMAASDHVNNSIHNHFNPPKSTGQKIRDAVDHAGEHAKSAAHSAGDYVKRAGENTVGHAQNAAGHVKAAASHAGEHVKAAAAPHVDHAKSIIHHGVDVVKTAAHHVGQFAHDHPEAVVGGAALAAGAAGIRALRKRRARKAMKESTENVVDMLEAVRASEPASFAKTLNEEIAVRLMEAIADRKAEVISETFGLDLVEAGE